MSTLNLFLSGPYFYFTIPWYLCNIIWLYYFELKLVEIFIFHRSNESLLSTITSRDWRANFGSGLG